MNDFFTNYFNTQRNRVNSEIAAEKRTADAEIDLGSTEDLARRNEATAARQNQSALLNRQGTRAGGGRYRRRGLFMTGGSGLNAANANALTAARKNARYAQIDQSRAAELYGINNPQYSVSTFLGDRIYV